MESIDTKEGPKEILYQIPRCKRAKKKFPGVEFFVAQRFSSPRGDERYWTLEWENDAFRFDEDGMTEDSHGSLSCNDLIHDIRPATAEQIAEFQKIRARVNGKAKKRKESEGSLLALCGLKRSDFIRFRAVYKQDDGAHLIVETRENGVGKRSVKALKNPNYKESMPDSGDSTYEYYRFMIPAQTH